jgi:DNA processing protein
MIAHDRKIFIWLSAVPGIGPQTLKYIHKLLSRKKLFLQEFLQPSQSFCKKIGLSDRQAESLRNFKDSFSPQSYEDLLSEKKISVICFDDEKYPKLLKEIDAMPFVLYAKGPPDFLNTLPISVVGTRRLTSYGEQATKAITSELLDLGATIVSGFMYGADMQAHLTALQKHGKTVGVLGYGFDFLASESTEYPVKKFLEEGNTFLTEFAPFVPAHKGNFPARNRIVAGMSFATVVTEAAQKSGSLITAQYALDYGRLVCAVPGPYTSIYSEGTKHLINQGAKLVTSGLEIISEIEPMLELPTSNTAEKNDQKKAFILQIPNEHDRQIMLKLHTQSESTDVLAEACKLDISTTLSRLSMLEVQGLIHRVDDKWWSYF